MRRRLTRLARELDVTDDAEWSVISARIARASSKALKDAFGTDDPEKIKKMKEEAEDFINGFKRFLTLRGVEVNTLQGGVSNFGAQVDSIIALVSGATSIM